MRTTDSALTAALNDGHVYGVAFVQLDFDSGILRLCTLPFNFAWNGFTWVGAGNLGEISQIDEGTDLEAVGVDLTLGGVDPAMISTALGEQYQGKTSQVWFAPLTDDGVLATTPVRFHKGRVDTMRIEVEQTATITLTAESTLADMFRARVSRFNHADQQARYPGDLGLQYLEEVVDKEIVWGRA